MGIEYSVLGIRGLPAQAGLGQVGQSAFVVQYSAVHLDIMGKLGIAV